MTQGQTVIIYQAKRWQVKLGLFLISLSLVGFAYLATPFLASHQLKEKEQSRGFASLLDQEAPQTPVQPITIVKKENRDEVKTFYLTIEKIGLVSAPVIPEVDADNKNLYLQALSQGLVHAQGSARPGENNLVYIFGHSTNYPWLIKQINALLFGIEKVEIGDKIKIEYNGEHYLYHIFDKKIVKPDDLSLLKQYQNQEVLVVQSCYPPGTSLYRILLIAQPSRMGVLIY